ncbi:SdpA family antimicrobial peptide system protein [Streptomyces sp. NL15-2K]|uniref:SdpA family antimicrobial peptide system protein n=1 Tax=Streptomyces sp. NL15-2K TaxID=376149 RepID=UPI000FF92783|nr:MULTISPECIES: SdpA family antimicrobial peptide system protein [Actinomycetes]WKX09257.1 SdpA family antimicrobial peptide system protein [Kutzneria buriramensis]GCB49256.1 hypothetical protein SNL152K_6590 [Streptomyces sp. NL15-2K]
MAAIVCLYGMIALYAVDSSLPTNALGLPGQNEKVLRSLLPQGWAFFTRSPREKDVLLWQPGTTAGEWRQRSAHQGSAGEWFGARREQRARNMEMGVLLTRALEKGARWSDCEVRDAAASLPDMVGRCASATRDAPSPVRVSNGSRTPAVCGAVAFTRQEPLPWSWARHGVDEQMPVQVLRARVTC